jgi:site-specific recombinase XerD
VGELVARLRERAGMTGTRLTPQTLRHTFGASLLDAGADLALVAVLMGHKRLDTTRRLAEEVSGIRSRETAAEALRALDRAYR